MDIPFSKVKIFIYSPHPNKGVDTTIMVHLFGDDGEGMIDFPEFECFVNSLQKELYQSEFLEYSMGADSISEEDFARIVLRFVKEIFTNYQNKRHRYSSFTDDIKDKYLQRLSKRLKKEDRRKISLEEFVSFCYLLQNIRVRQ